MLVGMSVIVVVGGAFLVYDPHPPGWKLTSAERSDIDAGGWKDALEPLETIPVEPNQAAEEVAERLAAEYCSERETRRLEEHNTDHDYVMFVPGCFEIDEPEHRLETPSAPVEVVVGGPPVIEFNDGIRERPCMVNAGAQYKGLGTCVHDLLHTPKDSDG